MRNWFLSLSLPLLIACGPGEEPQTSGQPASGMQPMAQYDAEQILALVNGELITEPMLVMHALRRTGTALEELTEDKREMLLLELVELVLIAQDAQQQELDGDPMLRARIHNMQRALMAQAVLEELRAQPVPEQELDTLYQQHYADRQETEYHARHILVDDEETARELISRLDQGAAFTDLARLHSTGPSAPDGGDLGWFTPDQMVPPFGEAATRLGVGEHSSEPVRTQFGWHVIRLEETRERAPPPPEAVREQLEQLALRKRMEQYVKGLRAQAEVQLYRPAEAD
ncbi:MAG: peptidylprolyl isomerase [Ectothiorhodospiraceae bacterium]|nr:peptidylprolyl isomerase [Ectothiorhodospiraceae bacterium]